MTNPSAPESPAKEQNAAPQEMKSGLSTHIPGIPAVAAPDVASMVRRLEQFASTLWRRKIDQIAANLMTEAAALLAKLGQGWIPVSEGLPRTPDDPVTAARVLVWTVRDGMGWIAVRFFRDRKWWSGGDEVTGETVTHWRELPPPPERP